MGDNLNDGVQADESWEDDILAGPSDSGAEPSPGAAPGELDIETGARAEATGVPMAPAAHRGAPPAWSAPTRSSPAWSLPRWSQPQSQQPTHLRTSFQQLPEVNQWFLGSGTALVSIALMLAVGPPLSASLQATVRPYTAAGKQETCATRIRAVALALAAYAQDHDGRFPPLDYQPRNKNVQQRRVTWVSLVRDRPDAMAEAGSFDCPSGRRLPRGQEQILSSYVLNPVLATAKTTEMDDAAATLMLADGSSKHDVSLLPPYPTWPSFAARKPDGTFDVAACNVDFRHSGQASSVRASVVYADGHAGVLSPGAWSLDAVSWGGSAVLRRARTRIAQSSPQAHELIGRLQRGDVGGAASYLAAHHTTLRPVSRQLVDLWRYNTGYHTSDSVEEMGWHLARAWQQAGDSAWQIQLNTLETQRSQEELQRTKSGEWEARTSEASYTYQAPSGWASSEEQEGRYKRTFVRAGLRHVFVLLEAGERNSYTESRPVDWQGMERDLRRRYGQKGYRRLRLESDTLLGWPAGLWEYEVEKPGSPRLRKLYLGYAEGWNSRVITCTAPAKDWVLWQPVFEQFLREVRL